MARVQIIGKEAIIEAFTECGYEAFALYDGKQLIVAGSGSTELETWIDRFCPPGMSGSFTLRLYDCSAEEIKNSTEYAASFPCRAGESYNSVGGFNSTYAKRLEALEKKGDDGDGGDKWTDAIMGWLEEPEKLVQVIGAVQALLGKGSPAQAIPAAIGAVIPATPAPGQLTQLEEQRYIELSGYLNTLEKADPHIVTHLGKLAHMSVNEPGTFKMMVSMLDKK